MPQWDGREEPRTSSFASCCDGQRASASFGNSILEEYRKGQRQWEVEEKEAGKRKEANDSNDREIDALFQLPLNEFTSARNALAARLSKAGHGAKAAKVKALGKPSISAWAVNQLYWRHNDVFNNLIAAGQHLFQAQVSHLAGKDADMQEAQAAQREALATLSSLADALLRAAGHKPTPDAIRRIHTTLETLSTYSSVSGTPRPGRLTLDVDPPGFESVSALIPTTGSKPAVKSAQIIPFKSSLKDDARKQKDKGDESSTSMMELHAAEQALRAARANAEDLAAAEKKAAADVIKAENKRREAERLYETGQDCRTRCAQAPRQHGGRSRKGRTGHGRCRSGRRKSTQESANVIRETGSGRRSGA